MALELKVIFVMLNLCLCQKSVINRAAWRSCQRYTSRGTAQYLIAPIMQGTVA